MDRWASPSQPPAACSSPTLTTTGFGSSSPTAAWPRSLNTPGSIRRAESPSTRPETSTSPTPGTGSSSRSIHPDPRPSRSGFPTVYRPIGIAVAADGDVYVTDERGGVVAIHADGSSRTVAGSIPGFRDGPGLDARFRRPTGVAVAGPARLIVADAGNALVRMVAAPASLEFRAPPAPHIATAVRHRDVSLPAAGLARGANRRPPRDRGDSGRGARRRRRAHAPRHRRARRPGDGRARRP